MKEVTKPATEEVKSTTITTTTTTTTEEAKPVTEEAKPVTEESKPVAEEAKEAIEEKAQEVLTEIDAVQDSLFDFLMFHPMLNNPWVEAALVFSVILLFALFVRFVVFLILKKISSKTSNNLDNRIITKLQSPVFVSIILFGVFLALRTIDLDDSLLRISNKVLLSIFFIIWMINIVGIVKMVLRYMAYAHNDKKIIKVQTLPLFLNLSFILTLVVFLYFVLLTWEVDMTAFVASAGVMGIALGFAAKDTLSNLISGVLILADQPYKIGDFVVLEAGDRGEVTHIGIRTTRIRTRDDVEVTVPNSVMSNTKVINESGGPYEKFRIRIKVGVAYGTKVEKVREVLLAVALGSDSVCQIPEPRVRLRTFGTSSLDFELLCWVASPILRGRVIDELNEKVYIEFIKAGIVIPFQQVSLHVQNGEI